MFAYINSERKFINKFYKVSITIKEAISIINEYECMTLDEFKDMINDKINTRNIGDILFIARLFAINNIMDYINNHTITNDESVYSEISKNIDERTLYVFGDKCQEQYQLYHFSTDEIADLLSDFIDDEDED